MVEESFPKITLYFFLGGSIVSLISSFFSILVYIFKKHLQTLAFRMVFQAQCANFFVSFISCFSFIIVHQFELNKDFDICYAHSYLMNFFNFLAILLVTNISFILYLSIFRPHLTITKISNYCIYSEILFSGILSSM